MKIFTFLISIFLISYFSNAQITFQKTYGGTSIDNAYSIQQTSDNGYIISGSTASFGAGVYDAYLIKTNAFGDTLWTRTYGAPGKDYSFCVKQTNDSGYIVCGHTESFGVGNGDVYLIKTNSIGDTIWTKTYGEPQVSDFGSSVEQTSDGGYIIGGGTENCAGCSTYRFFLVKTNMNGDTLWTKVYDGGSDDRESIVHQTTDGGYIIVGYTNSFGVGNYDVLLIKTDSLGATIWAKTYGGIYDDYANSVEQTTDDGYIIAGFTTSFSQNNGSTYLLKTDLYGNLVFTKTFSGIVASSGFSVRQTTEGGYIIVSSVVPTSTGPSDIELIKTDVNGDTLWTRSYGGNNYDQPSMVQQTNDGGFIIVGWTNSFGSVTEIYIIKTDSLGISNCNQVNNELNVDTALTQVTSANLLFYSAGIITSPQTLVGSGGTVTTLCLNVSTNEITSDNLFLISPNPTTDKLFISFEKTIMKGNVEILNILGENVFAGNIYNESQKEINLKNVSEGIYIVKVFDGEKSYCKKLIIE